MWCLLLRAPGPSVLTGFTALSRNSKRHQLQTNERLVVGDGFLLNLVSVLQHLGSKVKQDKLDPAYLQMDTYWVDTTDKSR